MKEKRVTNPVGKPISPQDGDALLVNDVQNCFLPGGSLAVSEAELQYLADTGRFSRDIVDYLSTFRFHGDVYAMPEGTVFFAGEPVIRVVAPAGGAAHRDPPD
jgi:nicotinic acid phosphoribosyltransferase